MLQRCLDVAGANFAKEPEETAHGERANRRAAYVSLNDTPPTLSGAIENVLLSLLANVWGASSSGSDMRGTACILHVPARYFMKYARRIFLARGLQNC